MSLNDWSLYKVKPETNLYAIVKHDGKAYKILVVDKVNDWKKAYRWIFHSEPEKCDLLKYQIGS